MKMRFLFAALAIGSFMAACDSIKADDALVGSWIRMRTSLEMRDRYTFGADGSFAFDENKPTEPQTEDHMTGTYVAANGVVTATATNTLVTGEERLTFSYYAGAAKFTSAALLPRGGHTGVVGAWTGIRKLEMLNATGQTTQGMAAEYEFLDDGTFRATLTPFDGSAVSVIQGAWVEEAGSTFRISWSATSEQLLLLDNAALLNGDQIWERE